MSRQDQNEEFKTREKLSEKAKIRHFTPKHCLIYGK